MLQVILAVKHPARAINVVVADDHPIIRAGLKKILQQIPQLRVHAEVHDSDALMRALARDECDLLLTDFSMPNGKGADGMRMLRRVIIRYPALPIIVFTGCKSPAMCRDLLAAGVKGIVDKANPGTAVVEAVQVVMEGNVFLSASVQCRLGRLDDKADRLLSGSEREVVRLLSLGLSVTQIADKHHRSVPTVCHQKRMAMTRVGAKTDFELFEYAKASGLQPEG